MKTVKTHTQTYFITYRQNYPPILPYKFLDSADYFQHNKIWGHSGSKCLSPLVYFCDGILIHSQRLRIAVAWHDSYIWHWTLNWKLRQLAVSFPSQEARNKLMEWGNGLYCVGLSASPLPTPFPCTIICSWCYRCWLSPAGLGIWWVSAVAKRQVRCRLCERYAMPVKKVICMSSSAPGCGSVVL